MYTAVFTNKPLLTVENNTFQSKCQWHSDHRKSTKTKVKEVSLLLTLGFFFPSGINKPQETNKQKQATKKKTKKKPKTKNQTKTKEQRKFLVNGFTDLHWCTSYLLVFLIKIKPAGKKQQPVVGLPPPL